MTAERRRLAGWLGAVFGAALGAAWIRFGPIDPSLLDRTKHASVIVTDRHGEVLYESLATTGARAEWLTADALPNAVVDATIAAEDRRFFRHPGVDPLAVARAAVHNVKAMRVVEGGSTITQQVAKLLLESRDRSLRVKMREAVLAMRLERRFTKKEILALYLNLAPYGNRIHGIARASRAYFGCGPEQLTPAQAAFLASLPQRPSAFNPLRDPQRARERQQHILARMHLSHEVLARAQAETLRFTPAPQPVLAMHFVERALRTAGSLPARPPAASRRVIRTSLDANLQRDILGIIAAHRPTLLRHGAHSAAVAVLDNATGEWLAWEGSGDYFGENFGGAIDGVITPRQPGSTLKPFTYALAFESGRTPATVLADVPSHFPTAEEGVIYTPRNYDGRYRGPLRARAALAGSQNVPAVAMLHQLGSESLVRLLHNAGFTGITRTADYYGLGLTLGDAEVTLEQLVTAYATFARGGKPVKPTGLECANASSRSSFAANGERELAFAHPRRFANGSLRLDETPQATSNPSTALRAGQQPATGTRLLSPRTAFWITDILTDASAREYAFGSGGSLDFPFPVAVKTGTSQAYRDNWTIGYTREVTVGVWVGNFDREPLRGSSGVTGAAPIFNAVMQAATKRARGALPIGDTTPIVPLPSDVEETLICSLSGARPSPYCPAVEKEWLPTDEPPRFCAWHHDGSIDWPAEFRAWAKETQPTPARPITRHASAFRIANPPDGATYMIDPTLRREYQTLRLRAVTAGNVKWRVNDLAVASSEWPLVPGVHTITAIDSRGHRDSVKIFVK